jgi:uncharacterized protein (AIM24 family)
MVSAGSYMAADPVMFEQKTERFRSENGGALSFLLSGESLYINKITNKSRKPENLVLSDNQVGTVVEITDELDTGILCLSGAFIAATGDVGISFERVRSFDQAALTGQSLWMQHCKNRNPEDPATVFLMAAAKPVEIDLQEGQYQMIDNTSLFAMTKGMRLRLYENEGLATALGGGEGRFMTVVEGPGKLWVAPERATSSSVVQQVMKMVIPG